MDQQNSLLSSWLHLFWENFFLKYTNTSLSLTIACQSPWTWDAANPQHPNFIFISDLIAKIHFINFSHRCSQWHLLWFLIQLPQKCSKNCLVLFWQERVMLHTRKILFKHTVELLFFHTGTTLRMEGEIRLLWDRATTYHHATIYHGHLISVTNNQTDILSQWHMITTTFYHSN